MPAIIEIQTGSGPVKVPTVWAGQHLAVHRPWGKGGLSKEPRHWAITHRGLGLSACLSFDGPKARAVELARLWDDAFSYITDRGTAIGWPFAQTWAHDLAVAQRGTSEIHGPILPDHPSYQDVAAAISAAVGGSYAAPTDEEAGEQFDPRETCRAENVRSGADGFELLWRGRWWPVPTVGEVEEWCLDSVAETPDGRTVEPDARDSWPSLLGLI